MIARSSRRPFALACLVLLASVLLMPAAVQAGGREALDGFTRGLKGLDGRFDQEVFDSKGRRKESSSGRVALAAPRRFRWEYVRPYPQMILADGAKVWVYDPDLKQVTVRAQGPEEQNSPLAALIDPRRLDRDFLVTDGGRRDGLDWLELAPRQADNASFQQARLGFDGKGLARMSVVDNLGQRTEVRFSGWKRNPSFAGDTFRFTPPKGVDVVGER